MGTRFEQRGIGARGRLSEEGARGFPKRRGRVQVSRLSSEDLNLR